MPHRFKRAISVFNVSVIALSSLLTLGSNSIVHAASGSDTCTWIGAATGSNSDNIFSNAANWSGCSSAAPVSGDSLVFDNTSYTGTIAITDDIASLSVGTITFQGNSENDFRIQPDIANDALTISSGIIDNLQEGAHGGTDINVNLNVPNAISISGISTAVIITQGTLVGSGAITVSGGVSLSLNGDDSGLTGLITVNGGTLQAMTNTAFSGGGVHINSGATLWLGSDNDITYGGDVSVGGTGNGYNTAIYVGGFGDGAGASSTSTLSGAVTLTSNVQADGLQSRTLKLTGALSGNYALTTATGSSVLLDIATSSNTSQTQNGSIQAPLNVVTVAAGDNQPNLGVTVGNNNEYIIDGQRGAVSVLNGGILKGTGQVAQADVSNGGVIAPGHSPGKLTVVSTLTLEDGSSYQAELKDKADGDFDQIVVGAPTDTTGNDVTLGTSTGSSLNVTLYDGFKITKGDTFEIINNLSNTAVKGTFLNLPEGATFTVSGYVFKISYVGGDGNDVVLTTQTVPATPDTGFAVIGAHPLITLGVSVIASGFILAIAQTQRNRKAVPVRVHAKK